MHSTKSEVTMGLRENWKQFSLLVLINALVGGMVGMERTILPAYAEAKFHIQSSAALLSFIVAFGFTKALANYATGRLANRMGRRNLLLWGWLLAMPVAPLLMWAPQWIWVVVANIFLGMSQGFTWSSTVVMKIDLVGPKNRGLAMGLNEFSGYLAVGLMAWLTGFLASRYGVGEVPFYTGMVISICGFLLTAFWVRDTRALASTEIPTLSQQKLEGLFWATTFKHPTLGSVTQAGMINNLNDGMIWGLLPVLLMNLDFDPAQSAWITAAYPAVWGLSQLVTGRLGDTVSHKKLLFWGMLLQGLAILWMPWQNTFNSLLSLSVIIGLGTALVYPTFLTAIAAVTHPSQRAETLGIFRFWRDSGYAFGALLSGIIADALGLQAAITGIGAITLLSAVIVTIRMKNNR
ncbi:MAG TPA: MFS transporter [Luteibaculaceae bacterium]|nr:MFS transporter [Luteibaculaceae bacterium]